MSIDTLSKEIVGPFEFGKFREIEKKYTKRKKQDINELKADEFQGTIDGNKMLEDGKTPLEIFRKNKNKIPYCKSYEGQDFVLLDKFYTKIDWNDLVTLYNDTNETVKQKYKGFIPFTSKYIIMTAQKLPNEAYNFGNHQSEDIIQCDFVYYQEEFPEYNFSKIYK
ncbi:9923_t:CDS:2, partial [Racocetra fulgida]